jgi:hypothetical protein
MALILDGNGLIQGLDAGGLPSGSVNADTLASTLDLSSKTMTFGNVSASGITFPASASASGNANTLDDYEEGTWTPTITFNSGSATVANPVCQYTKIGRMVHISGRFTLTSVVSPSGACIIGSLPFNANNPSGDGNRVGIQVYFENATARIGDDIVGLIFDGGSTMDVRRSGTTGAGADLGGSVQSSTVFLIGGFYAST